MHIKVLNKCSNKCFDKILDLLNKAFLKGTRLPKSYYEAKSQLRALGLGYESIDICKNDCVLFWKENANLSECPICAESQWADKGAKGKKVAHKVLRYFPITPRLKRFMYSSRHIAMDMRWHDVSRPKTDGILHHPPDAEV